MRKTKLVRERCKILKSITGAVECVWMRDLGYYTYQLFFHDTETAHCKIGTIVEKYSTCWVEYIGYVEMECEDELTPYFVVAGYVLEVTFLD
jgi:hypothetical protein